MEYMMHLRDYEPIEWVAPQPERFSSTSGLYRLVHHFAARASGLAVSVAIRTGP